ncbi:hypothetical protein [Nostoc sp. NMS4]|uniref:hypothetical protein n=1 Tax=Nostoc sp. NMS4 TaxID=2815390 RepID=UPI0025DDB107|nr:hypothetical protein [Nostoc sp. NMS4]MBN3924007.1 hypothetical protein [Nostoc sp. NMS4]
MATTKGKKRGPRATVLFKSGSGQGKGGKSIYVYMLRSVAEKLGFTIVKDATITRKPAKGGTKKEVKVAVRGSAGAKHIKVPVGGSRQTAAKTTSPNSGTKTQYVSIPVPASANIPDIKAFLGKASKKPDSFVSPDGRTYPLSTTK